jgi:GNAT superfamily N-acetyltransferase
MEDTTTRSGPAIRIRSAAPGDEALVRRFVHELAEYERLAHACEATEEALAASLFAASPRVFCAIAEADGEPAGFALWFYNFSTFLAKHGLYLEDLYVRPAFRGRGAGKALLKHLAQHAVAEGCGRFEWSVLDWNTPSIAFYESLGARAMTEWTGFRLDGEALTGLGQA